MSNEQIAREAAEKLGPKDEKVKAVATAIILAAIEKAYRQGLNEGFGKGKQSGRREANQPPATDATAEKIATEAAHEIRQAVGHYGVELPIGPAETKVIIRNALDKVVEPLKNECCRLHNLLVAAESQLTASQRPRKENAGEWTVETVRNIRTEAWEMRGRSYEIDKAIADAHNAALAAERELLAKVKEGK